MERREQAAAAWHALRAGAVKRRWWRSAPVVVEGPWPLAGRASVWALSQVVAAALHGVMAGVVEPAEARDLLAALGPYRQGAVYAPVPGSGERYYDDNAWVGLDLVQAAVVLGDGDGALVDGARAVLAYLRTGTRDGGVAWREGGPPTRHTCATAPTAELALHLAGWGDTGARGDAAAARAFLDRALRRPDGLYADNVADDGTVEPTVWSYNQGTPVGAAALWHRLTGDPAALAAARATADAALAHFGGEDRLWGQSPAFNAIFLRNLLLLDAVAGYPAAAPAASAYLDRVWAEARDPATGWFTGGGIGRYGRGGVLDQAGLVQLFALLAAPPGRWADIC